MAFVHVADGQDVPERAGVGRSPFPMPPQPMMPMPGRSLGVGSLGVSAASSCWRSTNQSGRPVAAAISLQRCKNVRRETLNVGTGSAADFRRRFEGFMTAPPPLSARAF